MELEIMSREKDKDVGEGKSDKPKAHWTIVNKKFFLYLTLEEKLKGNRPSKAFNVVGREKTFNEKTRLQFEFLQFNKPLRPTKVQLANLEELTEKQWARIRPKSQDIYAWWGLLEWDDQGT